jgi:hypothetical protein
VLCSDIDGPSPKIKISDLGLGTYASFQHHTLLTKLVVLQLANRAIIRKVCSRLQCVPPRFLPDGAAFTPLTSGPLLPRCVRFPFPLPAHHFFFTVLFFTLTQLTNAYGQVLVWLKPGVLGEHDNKYGGLLQDEWCMAKMIRMFETDENKMPAPPSMTLPEKELDEMPEPPSGEDRERRLRRVRALQKAYKTAYDLLEQPNDHDEDSMHVPETNFNDVLKDLKLSPAVESMLRAQLILDWKRRPTAQCLLSSTELHALYSEAKLYEHKSAARAPK